MTENFWKAFLLGFIAAFLFRITWNAIAYIQVKRLSKKHLKYLADKLHDFSLYVPVAKKYLQQAGIRDSNFSHVERLGYGRIKVINPTILDNIASKRADVAAMVNSMLEEAVGVFRMRLFECLNPLFWVQQVIFLPRNIFRYFGFEKYNWPQKIFQALWWLIAPLAIIFREKIHDFIMALFNK